MMSENTTWENPVICINLVCFWNYDGKCYDPCEELDPGTKKNDE